MDPESAEDRLKFADAMKRFYREVGQHDFRWRKKKASPYEVLIAVVFLQRTGRDQVARVFKDFISDFPDPKSLARTDLDEVRSLMEPLGLHWRANNVYEDGKMIEEKYSGSVPDDEEIFELPGVGSYVGKMVHCLAFGKKTAPVDTNVGRVLNRVFGMGRENITNRLGRDETILNLAKKCLPSEGVREYNLGLLDFGYEVCESQNPKCDSCPLASKCSENS